MKRYGGLPLVGWLALVAAGVIVARHVRARRLAVAAAATAPVSTVNYPTGQNLGGTFLQPPPGGASGLLIPVPGSGAHQLAMRHTANQLAAYRSSYN